ncbi:ATP-binding protein [Streptomyces sp. ME19-01-6]|uniref:ATP-binding protein n=1 Tax=Streptomyces sp. ME19-01-6 TaxID=3028686 RepID=UPI0029ACC1C4|nr:ATP-binding protein [Streptomyces sp. ME19-01-6]MDX3232528.1 ATP-binding protein [Streptomyces sp. ME19-01-6]
MTPPPTLEAHPGHSDPSTREALRRARLDRQERPQLPPVRGLFPRHRARGFVAQMAASDDALSAVRKLTATVPVQYGADSATAEAAELVVSELISNAVKACGDGTLLFVEVHVTDASITVAVHDSRGDLPLDRSEAAMDSAEAESGRGLYLLDVLAPGWTVAPSPIGKQVRCQVRALAAA